jgi:hypothetical protein
MSPARKRLFLTLKTALAVVVIGAVGWHFYGLLTKPEVQQQLTLRVEYLIPAGMLYLACHTLWGTFWVQLLRGQGATVGWLAGVRAYFVSQFGKYVPGKAWVIVLRVGLLKRAIASPAVVIVTGTYETLTNMAAGAVLGACLLPFSDQLTAIDERYRAAVPYSVALLAFVPLVLFALNKLIHRVATKYRKSDAEPIPLPSLWLVARGMLQAMVGWCLLGLSAWLTACGLSAEPVPLTPGSFAQHLCAVCVAYVIGFAALFLPAGGGARELVLQWMLLPPLGAVSAAVAVVLRVVWTVAEAVAAVGLYFTPIPSPPIPPAVHPPGERAVESEVPA